MMRASSTPGMASKRSSSSSAKTLRRFRLKGPESTTWMMGMSEKFISVMTGSSSRSEGRSPRAWSTLSRVFCRASSMSTLGRNLMAMVDLPSSDLEVSSSTPSSPLSLRSRGMVTSFSMSSGATPS